MLTLVTATIVLGSLVALAGLICGTILLIVKIRGEENSPRGTDREEARIIQEIYQGLEKMESRIEALEVILSENKSTYAKAKKRYSHTTQQEKQGGE